MLLTFPRMRAHMHACTRNGNNNKNTNNSCTHSLECSGGPIVAHFNIVMGYRFNFECALLQYTTLYTLKTKPIKPSCERLPLIE